VVIGNMNRCSLALLLFLISINFLSFESSGNWQNTGGDLEHSGYSEIQSVPLKPIWKYAAGTSDISAPVIDSSILFVGSDDGNIHAIDITSGKLKWKYQTNGKVDTPTAKNGAVYAGSFDNNIYALDYKGNLIWQYSAGGSTFSPPIVYNNILYGGFDRNIYAIYTINGSLKWKYTTGGLVESAPAISQGILYAGSNDRYVYALDAGNKDMKWMNQTGGSISSSPSVVNGVVYVGSKDNSVYAIDSGNGELKWKKKTNDWIESSPAVFENSVYVGSDDSTVYSLNTDSGNILWTFNARGRVRAGPVVIRGIVYAGSDDGTIYALDTTTGSLIDSYPAGGGIISLALSDNMLFATSKDGYVYAFGESAPETSTAVPVVVSHTTPPVLRINPVPLNVTSDKLTVSGTAEDPSGILVVTVNGINAGTGQWNATITLSKGTNTVTIVAVDKMGNIQTETRTVTYSGTISQETPTVKTPGFSWVYVGFVLAVYILRKRL
jgi:outer membrane protein assembly factor BamB